jgi:uncharacterized protein
MYRDGKGVAQDHGQALVWFRKAANQGNALGQVSLGWMYQDGEGVVQDYKQAVAWYHKAANQGNALGQYYLGCMYRYGKGVQQNQFEASRLSELAMKQLLGYALLKCRSY